MTGSSSDGEHVRRIKSTALDSPSELPGWEVSFWKIVVRHERRLSADSVEKVGHGFHGRKVRV